MLLYELLAESASRHPDRPYIISDQESWTYAGFLQTVNAVRSSLININVKRGERVVISLGNRAEALVLFFASVSIGAIAVPLSPKLPPAKLAYVLDNCEPTAFFGDRSLNILNQIQIGDYLKSIINLWEGVIKDRWNFSSRVLDYDEFLQHSYDAPFARIIDLDPAMIVYTSGSTGDPKGIVCTHLNIISATRSITTYLGLGVEDRIVNFQPLFFDYGLYQCFLTAYSGASLCLIKSFLYPEETINIIRQQEITVIPFVPTNIVSVFNRQKTESPISCVRIVTNTGSRFPVHLLPAIKELFPNAAIFSMYGLTECKRVSYLPPDQLDVKSTSVGIPMPNIEAWLVDENDLRVPPTVVGELVVRGSNVAREYWRDSDSSSKTFRVQSNGERLLYTGDFFKMDDDGFLYFIGRRDDLIKVGGYRTSTKEIESTISSLECVQEVAAISIPDTLLGNSTKVFILLKADCIVSEEDIRRLCRNLFESNTLIPKKIEIKSELPRTDTGKIDYKALI